MNTRLRFLTPVLALGLVVAACGDSDEAEPSAEQSPVTVAGDGTTGDAAMMPTGPACGAVPADGEGSFTGMADDPAATAASNNPVLSTLVTAVGEAGLVDTLNGDGPFTIFAPTNDAFAALPEGALDAALADPDGLLTEILTYHVVAGESLDIDGLDAAGTVTTVEGDTVSIVGTTVDDSAEVVCGNVSTANATVHIIDSVLLPPAVLEQLGAIESGDEGDMAASGEDDMAMESEPTGPACGAVPADGEGSFTGMADDPAATAASNNPLLSTLVTAVSEAGLVDTLNGEGPFTIFAPTNDAFAAIPEADLAAVMADPDLLTSVLTFHVVAGERLSAADLAEQGTVTTVNGGDLTFSAGADDSLTINGGAATVVCADVPTANATVHIIDGVLLP